MINKRDVESCHKFNNKLKSINETNNKNVFKYEFIGCGQIFFFKKSFINHKNQHLFDINLKNENYIKNDDIIES